MPIRLHAFDSEAELPFAIYTDDNVPVTGYAFSTGDVKVRVPGNVLVNADTANIVECGFGQYVLQLTAAQTAAEGAVFVTFDDGTNRPWSNYEMIASVTDELLEIPFVVYDDGGVGQTGYSFATGDLKIRLPGETSYVNADVANIDELGAGQYVLTLTAAQRAAPGAVFVHFSDGANRDYDGYELNAEISEAVVPVPTPPDPIPVVVAASTVATYDHVTSMLNRLPEYAKQEVT